LIKAQVLIVGGGTGGFAAALSACRLGLQVVMTEETRWIGGQLTAQIVPPDEHPWIEQFGCTNSYREFRNRVRQLYRSNPNLTASAQAAEDLNPGGGWVSRLCFEPKLGVEALNHMIEPYLASGQLRILYSHKPFSAEVNSDFIHSVRFFNLESGNFVEIAAPAFVDATELGDLLALTGTAYVSGAESKSQTNEPNAVEGPPQPENVQGFTWCFALEQTPEPQPMSKPDNFEFWKAYKPEFWPGPLLGFQVLHAHTGVVKELPLYGKNPQDWYALFPYRQVIDPVKWRIQRNPTTVVNWPQNDYFLGNIIDADPIPSGNQVPTGFEIPGAMGPKSAALLMQSRELSQSLLYWLQTLAPHHDGKSVGYANLRMAQGITGTEEGFAMYPYIRESRRILAQFTLREQDVAAYTNPGRDRAPTLPDSVGIGAYRIDLHPSANGANTIDTSTLPFQIPLSALVPVKAKNLIPASKNIGTTHITNGCYRLHPVEWNIGEVAGIMAADIINSGEPVQSLTATKESIERIQSVAVELGVEIHWPDTETLKAL
jgi:hypothetical protein